MLSGIVNIIICFSQVEPHYSLCRNISVIHYSPLTRPFFATRPQGVIVEEAPVSSSYTFEYCSLFSSSAANRDCVTYSTTEVEIAPMVPAFLYKYEVCEGN